MDAGDANERATSEFFCCMKETEHADEFFEKIFQTFSFELDTESLTGSFRYRLVHSQVNCSGKGSSCSRHSVFPNRTSGVNSSKSHKMSLELAIRLQRIQDIRSKLGYEGIENGDS